MYKKPTNQNEIKAAFLGVDRKLFHAKLNALLGNKLTDVSISQIVNGDIVVGAVRAAMIELATDGKVKASTMRPDIFK